MANLHQDNVRIQVLISTDTPQGRFNDALYFSKEEFDALSEDALDAIKTQRVNSWVSSVQEASKREYIPTTKDIEEQKAALQIQIDELDAKLLEVAKTK